MVNEHVILDEGPGDRVIRKLKENPFIVVGLGGFLGALTLGAMNYRNRPKQMGTALYLINLRLTAQGAVIGSLTVGMIYGMLTKHVFKSDKPSH